MKGSRYYHISGTSQTEDFMYVEFSMSKVSAAAASLTTTTPQ